MADAATLQRIIDEVVPVLLPFGSGRWAVAISGSYGKGLSDERSDVDFRLYADHLVPDDGAEWQQCFARLTALMERWRAQGVEIDWPWCRSISQVDESLNAWLSGTAKPEPYIWTLWGYHLPCDLYHQRIVEDPCDVISGWKQRLSRYPEPLRKAVIGEHLASLQYWRRDYHYASKVARKDSVFLVSLTARLLHNVMQVLFALNYTYYVGDGSNMHYVRQFALMPDRFEDRVAEVLALSNADSYDQQYAALVALIDDVESLADER